MDKLETVGRPFFIRHSAGTDLTQAKSERPDDDAIVDDVAGKAVVEQFGLDVFSRAENAMRANKVTR